MYIHRTAKKNSESSRTSYIVSCYRMENYFDMFQKNGHGMENI